MLCGHFKASRLAIVTGYHAALSVRFLRMFNSGSPPSPCAGQPWYVVRGTAGFTARMGRPPPGLVTTVLPLPPVAEGRETGCAGLFVAKAPGVAAGPEL